MTIDLLSFAGLLQLVINGLIWVVLVILFFALPAPYLAFRLLRRNRCLGRDIYRELAQADRFMNVWIEKNPLVSNDQQYIWAFVPNGNNAAARNSKIDDQLAKWKLVDRYQDFGTYNAVYFVRPMRGKYLLRNWIIFFLLLFLRITFLGDRSSHIASGSGRFNERTLKRMYWETAVLISVLVLFLIFVIVHVI